MTRDEETPDFRLFDRRIVERNIKRGSVNRKDYEKFLKSLPDVAGKIAPPEDAAAPAAAESQPPQSESPPASSAPSAPPTPSAQ